MRSSALLRSISRSSFGLFAGACIALVTTSREAYATGRVTVQGRGVSVGSSGGSSRNYFTSGSSYRGNRGYYAGGRYYTGGAAGGAGAAFGFAYMEMALEGGAYAPQVSSREFAGESIRRSTGEYVTVTGQGRDFGFHRPVTMDWSLHLRWSIGPYFSVGAWGGVHSLGAFDLPSADPQLRAITGTSSRLWGFTLAPELYAMIPVGPVTFRVGGGLGLRSYNFTAQDLEYGDCTWVSTGGVVHDDFCHDSIGALSFFVQPRAQVDIQLGGGFVLGLYGGVELFPLFGFSGGVTLGLQTPGFGGRVNGAPIAPPPPENTSGPYQVEAAQGPVAPAAIAPAPAPGQETLPDVPGQPASDGVVAPQPVPSTAPQPAAQ